MASFSCCFSSAQQPDSSSLLPVGGPCEGCEALLEYGDRKLSNEVTIPGYDTAQQKLRLEGTVYQADGKTPAEGIILYFYHTNAAGIYAPGPKPIGWERSHGLHRGWAETGPDGKYTIYTQVPAPYPGRTEPAHIHITVGEPGMTPYYIESIHFDGDPLLDYHQRSDLGNRGGSGIVLLEKKGNTLFGRRDIILGKNIPGYPK